VLGGKVQIPTIGGKVAMTVPAGANSGQTLRLKGRGVKGKGDQFVKLNVVMPEKIDDELRAFIEEWKKTHAYDPRRTMKEQA
jgi:DnaJ-class molecular chaperone